MTYDGAVLAQGDPLYLSGSHVSNRKSGCVGMITPPPAYSSPNEFIPLKMERPGDVGGYQLDGLRVQGCNA